MRADSGKAISSESPNFVAGAAGGSGWATAGRLEPGALRPALGSLSGADLVWVPTASLVTAGGCQGAFAGDMALLGLAGRIVPPDPSRRKLAVGSQLRDLSKNCHPSALA
jgi:hypothetical protein